MKTALRLAIATGAVCGLALATGISRGSRDGSSDPTAGSRPSSDLLIPAAHSTPDPQAASPQVRVWRVSPTGWTTELAEKAVPPAPSHPLAFY